MMTAHVSASSPTPSSQDSRQGWRPRTQIAVNHDDDKPIRESKAHGRRGAPPGSSSARGSTKCWVIEVEGAAVEVETRG